MWAEEGEGSLCDESVVGSLVRTRVDTGAKAWGARAAASANMFVHVGVARVKFKGGSSPWGGVGVCGKFDKREGARGWKMIVSVCRGECVREERCAKRGAAAVALCAAACCLSCQVCGAHGEERSGTSASLHLATIYFSSLPRVSRTRADSVPVVLPTAAAHMRL